MRPDKTYANEFHWFRLWVLESFSVRQLSRLSGHSSAKIKRIKNYWLAQTPPEKRIYKNCKYLIFDGTYFHKNGCLLVALQARIGRIIHSAYVDRERYESAFAFFMHLRQEGIMPEAITLDGHLAVMAAARAVWPDIVLQRCLYHIQHEGMRWLRSCPKTLAGQQLRKLLRGLSAIKTAGERDRFWLHYDTWRHEYEVFVRAAAKGGVAQKDLKKTMALLNNARNDMFHFLSDENIESTTNRLEGFNSRLKADYRRHRGLSA